MEQPYESYVVRGKQATKLYGGDSLSLLTQVSTRALHDPTIDRVEIRSAQGIESQWRRGSRDRAVLIAADA